MSNKLPINIVERPVHPQMLGYIKAHDGAHDELTASEVSVLRFLQGEPLSRDIAEHLALKSRSGHLHKTIDHFRTLGLIESTIPEKPQSKNQKMRITPKGRLWLAENSDV